MITLHPVKPEEKEILWNYLQKYLYELSGIYGLELDDNGNFPYPYFEPYFSEEKRRAFFFKEDGKIIGFTMINTYSVTETPADHSIAEFSVLPSYRKKKVATRMMDLLLEQYPGQWQIKYSANNHPAKKLWTGIGARFGAKPISYGEHEEVIEFIR